MQKEYVICLQEVDVAFSNSLQIFFNESGYNFYYHPYGHAKNGYMGVATAVPRQFKVLAIDRVNPVDTEGWPAIPKETWAEYFKGFLGYKRKDFSLYKNFIGRRNFVLMLSIQDCKDFEPIEVFNIHMPCVYREQSFMELYLYLVLRHIGRRSSPGSILAGDFNIQPGSIPYNLVADGEISGATFVWYFENFPEPRKDFFSKIDPMKSALRMAIGEEPKHTNKSYSCNNDFAGTVDYIFISGNLDCSRAGVAKKPGHDDYNGGYMPHYLNPSDHFPIFAEIKEK